VGSELYSMYLECVLCVRSAYGVSVECILSVCVGGGGVCVLAVCVCVGQSYGSFLYILDEIPRQKQSQKRLY
jgi:hypothetical protein